MVLSSYHWLHEKDGTIFAPSQSKSMGRQSETLDSDRPSPNAEQDTAMSEQPGNEDIAAPAMTRRAALAAAAVAPLSIGPAASDSTANP